MGVRDDFARQSTPLDGPADTSYPIVKSDTIDLPFVTRGIYVGTSGDITVIMLNGLTNPVLYKNVPVGILPIRVSRVNSTGTTAADMVALA